jgi:hydrogenase maturation protein HypF
VRLGKIADYFLVHDREILQRCDDSIVQVVGGRARLIRRARGYVPEPALLNLPTPNRILACGGELKNTIALSRDEEVFLSQHIGDLDNPLAIQFFEDTISHLSKLLEIEPEVVAYDMHPEYLSTKWALEKSGLPAVPVQHHHAHLAALLAENQTDEPIIGIALDGTGYGLDGTIWGGEILVGDCTSVQRYAWLQPFPLPGGAGAIRQPWRTALAVLGATYKDDFLRFRFPFLEKLDPGRVDLILDMISKEVNSPPTSSCGRLFDAVAAILGIRSEVTYEAQAAVELEMAADVYEESCYERALENLNPREGLDWMPLVREVVEEFLSGKPVSTVAAKFHRTLAEIFVEGASAAREEHGFGSVGLTGGVFQNRCLLSRLVNRLEEEQFKVLTHSQFPANDGGIALGQVAVAAAQLRNVHGSERLSGRNA